MIELVTCGGFILTILGIVYNAKLTYDVSSNVANLQKSLIESNARTIKLQKDLLESQDALRKIKDSLLQKEDYFLASIGIGGSAYVSKFRTPTLNEVGEVAADGVHYACQQCFDTKFERHILQTGFDILSGDRVARVFVCHNCHSKIYLEVPSKKTLKIAQI